MKTEERKLKAGASRRSFQPARRLLALVAGWLLLAGGPVDAQVAPGPYEILPFQDAFILEAWKDLDAGTTIADWTGRSASSWVSPGAYNGHTGTDFSMQTGTPLYAAAPGVVSAIETQYAKDSYTKTSGNFVLLSIDTPSPNGESLDLKYGHMLSVAVSVGQRVQMGELLGLSDNTGQSDSEHLHLQSEIRGGAQHCPFYWAHFKYPILFNPAGTHQVGRVLRVKVASTPVRSDRFDSSSQITTAWQGQLFYSSYPKRGYYQVFLPNNTSYRSGWIRATAAEEVLAGTVLQPLPDDGTYVHSGQLQNKYILRAAPGDGASQVGQIVFGGGRFVADQITNGYYRVPVPGGSAAWGWVKPNNRMVVYPQLVNPSFNLALLPKQEFPIKETFSAVTNKLMFGRPKFNRSSVKAFSPASPGGDGKAAFVTHASNKGTGATIETVLVGQPGHTNYYVQCDVYFNFKPSYLAGSSYERFGIFLRDDGFAGLDTTYEGAGNAYALLWDDDDGNLRPCKLVDGGVTNFFSPSRYYTNSGWHTMRIEARGSNIKYFLDGQLLIEVTDTAFASGPCGFGYSQHSSTTNDIASGGAYFDNFSADTLEVVPPRFDKPVLQADGVRFTVSGNLGATNFVEHSATLTNWTPLATAINTNGTIQVVDTNRAAPARFYRARRP